MAAVLEKDRSAAHRALDATIPNPFEEDLVAASIFSAKQDGN